MIERYSRPEMAAIWSDEGRFARWLEVEITVCEVLAERGVIPRRGGSRDPRARRASTPRASPRSRPRCATT